MRTPEPTDAGTADVVVDAGGSGAVEEEGGAAGSSGRTWSGSKSRTISAYSIDGAVRNSALPSSPAR